MRKALKRELGRQRQAENRKKSIESGLQAQTDENVRRKEKQEAIIAKRAADEEARQRRFAENVIAKATIKETTDA